MNKLYIHISIVINDMFSNIRNNNKLTKLKMIIQINIIENYNNMIS